MTILSCFLKTSSVPLHCANEMFFPINVRQRPSGRFKWLLLRKVWLGICQVEWLCFNDFTDGVVRPTWLTTTVLGPLCHILFWAISWRKHLILNQSSLDYVRSISVVRVSSSVLGEEWYLQVKCCASPGVVPAPPNVCWSSGKWALVGRAEGLWKHSKLAIVRFAIQACPLGPFLAPWFSVWPLTLPTLHCCGVICSEDSRANLILCG